MILLVGALSVQYQSPGDCGVCVERGAESVAEFGSCWRAQAVQCSAVATTAVPRNPGDEGGEEFDVRWDVLARWGQR